LSWIRLDDAFGDHPKVVSVGKTALAVHLWGLCYCSRQLTDGFVPLGVLSGCPWVSKRSALQGALRRLEGAGLWKAEDGGYRIHDYLEYNPDAASVREKRRRNAERQARHRERQKHSRNDRRNALRAKDVTHPPTPPPKGGENGAAPLGRAPVPADLPLDDCMKCFERRPLLEQNGSLLCHDCLEGAE
jgi:hypothetical protein